MIDRKNKSIHREFLGSVDEFIARANFHRNKDIYFGVSTRYGKGSGKKRDCYRLQTVWVDIDKKRPKECSFNPKPNIIVDSGGGTHAYWILKSPLLVRSEQRWVEIEAVNRGLCNRFRADLMAVDISRILRVPGFKNTKYDPLREVRAFSL